MDKLVDLSKVLRSKNSGPFEVTVDVILKDQESYERVKASGVLDVDKLAKLYSIAESDILEHVFFDAALAFKFTMKRDVSSGTVGDRDVYGAQQHAPLLEIFVP